MKNIESLEYFQEKAIKMRKKMKSGFWYITGISSVIILFLDVIMLYSTGDLFIKLLIDGIITGACIMTIWGTFRIYDQVYNEARSLIGLILKQAGQEKLDWFDSLPAWWKL